MQTVSMSRSTIAESSAMRSPVAEVPASAKAAARYWMLLAVATLLVILAAVIRWSLAHPFGVHWDEAGYLNEALADVQRLRHGMLVKFAGRILLRSWGRPPVYRLLADPVLAVFGTGATVARLVSLACYSLSVWYVFRATALISTRIAGAVAALVFCLSPEVIGASSFFGTDAPLYLATSAMLYYLFRTFSGGPPRSREWIGLGLAMAVGCLAKTSFLLMGPPAVLCWGIWTVRRSRSFAAVAVGLKAMLLAMVLAGPWWILNFRGAWAYGRYARGFVRNSLGPPSLLTWSRWLDTVVQCLVGHAVSVILALVLVGFLVTVLRGGRILTTCQRVSCLICGCAGLPIIAAQLLGTNHLLRHVSPAMVPLAIVGGLMAEQTFWTRTVPGIATCTLLFISQLAMIVYPVVFPNQRSVSIGFVNGTLPWRTLARVDQWNWKPVWQLSEACGVSSPRIVYLGGGREFDPPAMQYPWVAAALPTALSTFPFPDVTWLWRYEDGPPDWQSIMTKSDQSDLVITAPGYAGEPGSGEAADNRYNAAFAARLSQDPHFQAPMTVKMGRFEPVEVAVFIRQGLSCRMDRNFGIER